VITAPSIENSLDFEEIAAGIRTPCLIPVCVEAMMSTDTEPHQRPTPITKAIDLQKRRQAYQDRIAKLPDPLPPKARPRISQEEKPKEKNGHWKPPAGGYVKVAHSFWQAIERHFPIKIKIMAYLVEHTLSWKDKRPDTWNTCEINQKQLAEKWEIARQTVSRALKEMRTKGWIYRNKEGEYGIQFDFALWQLNGQKPKRSDNE